MQTFLAELKRRNVLRVAGLYFVGAWLITQVAGTVLPMFDAPPWMARSVVLVLAIAFVPVLVLSWLFELTPQGLKLDANVDPSQSIAPQTARRLDRILLVAAALAIAYFAIDKFVLAPRREAALVAEADAPSKRPAASAGKETNEHSIAVLPFLDLSQAKDQEYFSDGLSEELLNLLAQLPQLRVIARTSSFSFKGKEVDVATIAKALDVGNILEGSVRKSGNTLRVTAQLIRTSDSSHLWSQTFDRELTDVFKLQDEIAADVVAALKVKLLPAQEIANPYRSANTAAYEQYLLGRQLNYQQSTEGWTLAIDALTKAVTLDPNYAAAYSALGSAQGSIADLSSSGGGSAQDFERALDSARKAIELAPNLADGYVVRSFARVSYQRDWAGARADLEKALALNPSNSGAVISYARLMAAHGRLPEAIAASKKATEIDPILSLGWIQVGRYLAASGRLDEARPALDRALAISPDSDYARTHLGIVQLLTGDAAGAAATFRKTGGGYGSTGVAMAQFTLGDMAASQAALDESIARYAQASAYQIADAYAWRGESDKAFEWLDRAYAQNDGGLASIKIDPLLAKLRADPRYAAMVAKLGLSD
jgi:serine/threonine-protein kinase